MSNLYEKLTHKTFFLLIVIFLLSIIIRSVYLNATTFGYDQARDVFEALDIWGGDPIKILGPQSDSPGLYHGPFYWYLISPVLILTNSNLTAVKFELIILNSLSIFLVFDLTNSLFKRKRTAFLASLIFAFSFEATQYARWISNPSAALFTAVLSFWALKKLIDGKPWALALLLFSWGLSVQLQLFMLYQIVVFPLIWVSIKGLHLPKISLKNYLFSIMILASSLSTYIAAEIKFHLQGFLALTNLLKSDTLVVSFTEKILVYLDRLVNVFYLNIWGVNFMLAGFLATATVVSVYILIKNRRYKNELIFLLIWLLSPLLLHFFKGTSANYITLGTGTSAIILTAFIIDFLIDKTRKIWILYLAAFLILAGNLNLILNHNKNGEVLFSVQHKVLLEDELKVIDWIYSEGEYKSFKLNTFTNPLFINTTWSYLFDWYARKKYGFMPIWWGETQVGVYGSNVKFSPEKETDLEFLIIEPQANGDDGFLEAVKQLEDSRSQVTKTAKLGSFIVEKRKIFNPRIFTNQDVFYILLNKPKIPKTNSIPSNSITL